MSKLNLISLTKDELAKEEAQKIKAGGICGCSCTCSCSCPAEDRFYGSIQTKFEEKVLDLSYYSGY